MKSLKFNPLMAMILFLGLILNSCDIYDWCECRIVGEGPVVTKTLNIDDFTGIHLQTISDVTISQGTTQSVTVTGHQNIIDILNRDVSGNIWDIGFESECCVEPRTLSVDIIVPDLEDIKSSSTGDITVNNFSNQGDLNIALNSTGDIEINEFTGTENLTIVTSSTGNIIAKANFPSLINLNIKLSSTGNYEGFLITAINCTVKSNSSGKVEVSVEDNLDVTINSTGNVYYKGNPSITLQRNSSGRLIDAN